MDPFLPPGYDNRPPLDAVACLVLERARAATDRSSLQTEVGLLFETALRDSRYDPSLDGGDAERVAAELDSMSANDESSPCPREVARAYRAAVTEKAKTAARRMLEILAANGADGADSASLGILLGALTLAMSGGQNRWPPLESPACARVIEQLPIVAPGSPSAERACEMLRGASWAARYLNTQKMYGGWHRRERGHAVVEAFRTASDDAVAVADSWLRFASAPASHLSPMQNVFVSLQQAIGIASLDLCEGDTISVGIRECLESPRMQAILEELERASSSSAPARGIAQRAKSARDVLTATR